MTTGDATYNAALRPRITIKTIDGADTLYEYNAFDSSHDITVTSCDTEGAIGESGTFNIRIDDSNNVVPKDNIHSVKVFIELGKKETEFKHFMIGYGDVFQINRPGTNQQVYSINGFGSSIWASQLFIHRREKYKKDESNAKIYNIVRNALTKRKWRPLKTHDRSIEDITGWSEDGISTKVNIPFTTVNKPFVYFSDLLNELCDISGAVWFIDYEDGNETLTLTYNSALATPIIIKSGDLADRVNDEGKKTAYIKSGFVIDDNATIEAGTATRLITTTVQDNQEMFSLDDAKNINTLDFKALAQQVIIDNDARRIEEIELKLKKIGDPTSPKDRINGDICLDGGNKPTGTILDEFHVDLGSIEEGGSVHRIPVEIKARSIDTSQVNLWVRLFQRSGTGDIGDGNPQHDPKNTIGWYHNNVFNATQPYRSSKANEGDEDKKAKLSWQTTDQGPMYYVKIFSNIRRLFARTNGKASKRIRLRESFINTDFLEDPSDVTRYLSLALSQSSKGRRGIADLQVTLPNDFIFKPYQWVAFHDGLSDTDEMVQVQRARYVMGAQVGDPQIGTLSCNLTLSGLYNTLVGGCSCL